MFQTNLSGMLKAEYIVYLWIYTIIICDSFKLWSAFIRIK